MKENTCMICSGVFCKCELAKEYDSIKDMYPVLFDNYGGKGPIVKEWIPVSNIDPRTAESGAKMKEGTNTPEGPEKCDTGQFEGFEKHLHHSLYQEASKTWLAEQIGQIKKGAEKYLEPLNPAAWTFEELFKHAVQENVDQMHYLQAMFEKFQEFENKIVDMTKDLIDYEKKNAYFQEQLKKALNWIGEAEKKHNALVNQCKELEQANRELLQQNETVQHLQQENAELREWKEQAMDVMKQAAVRLLDDAIEKWLRK